MARYVVGDIHGNFRALKEVLTLSAFDYKEDELIILGDVCDGHNQTKECVEELLKIENRFFVLGNHDLWFAGYIKDMDNRPNSWIYQGGDATLESYQRSEPGTIPQSHRDFFCKEGLPYYEVDGMCFVHGGFPYGSSPQWEDLDELVWNRKLCYDMKSGKPDIPQYKKVFVGHTTTQMMSNELKPLKFGNLWMLDVGAGWDGKLCLMDIDTEKYWLSGTNKAPQH